MSHQTEKGTHKVIKKQSKKEDRTDLLEGEIFILKEKLLQLEQRIRLLEEEVYVTPK